MEKFMNMQRRKNYFIERLDLGQDQEAVIDSTFKSVVLAHIAGNYMKNVNMPLFLAIQGYPGEGKTFQTLKICMESGVKICYISGAELSGNYEKDSILDLEENYIRACNYFASENVPCVIIIDDFHLSPASTKNGVGTTVNSQILTGFLMNLCDKAKSIEEYRTPVILIGNSFKDVYEPLKRDGRMDFFTWRAPLEQKYDISYNLFRDLLSKKEMKQIQNFVESYKEQPVSFFKEIKNDIVKERMRCYFNQSKKFDVGRSIFELDRINTYKVDLQELYELAEKRLKSNYQYSYEGKCDGEN